MKKINCSLFLIIIAFSSSAQSGYSNSILVRHDTALLNADECEWLIKSLVKNDPALTSEIGKPLPLILLEAIEKGKLKAIDPQTNKPIPAKEIFTWGMGTDTIALYDDEGNITKYQAIKRIHTADNFTQVRIFQDWYFDVSGGKFYSVIKWIELMANVVTSQGVALGARALCRIYY